MNRISIRSVAVTLSYYSVSSDHFSKLTCRGCRGSLDIHQPSLTHPDQFLGTCSDCGRWYRVASSMDEVRLTVLEIPDVAEIIAPSSTPRDTPG